MNEKEIHRKVKRSITSHDIARIRDCDTPEIATNEVMRLGPISACALVDSSDPLTAAFIVNILRERANRGDKNAIAFIERADRLNIRGTKGLCHARDEIYRKMGVLLV